MALTVKRKDSYIESGFAVDLKSGIYQSLGIVLEQLSGRHEIKLNPAGMIGLRMTHKEYMAKFGKEFVAIGHTPTEEELPYIGSVYVIAQPVFMAIFLREYGLAKKLLGDKSVKLTKEEYRVLVCERMCVYYDFLRDGERQVSIVGEGDIISYALADPKMPDDLRLHILTQIAWERSKYYGKDISKMLSRPVSYKTFYGLFKFPLKRKNMDARQETRFYMYQSLSTLELLFKKRKRYFKKTSSMEWKSLVDAVSYVSDYAERLLLILMKYKYHEIEDRKKLLYYYFDSCNCTDAERLHNPDNLKLVEAFCRQDKRLMQIFSKGVVRAYTSVLSRFVENKMGTIDDIKKGNYGVEETLLAFSPPNISRLRAYAGTMIPKGVSLESFLNLNCGYLEVSSYKMVNVYPNREVLLYAYKSLTGRRIILTHSCCRLMSNGDALYDFDEDNYMIGEAGVINVMRYDGMVVGLEEAMTDGFRWIKEVDEFRLDAEQIRNDSDEARGINEVQRELIDNCAMDLFIMALRKGAFANPSCYDEAISYAVKDKFNGDKVACMLAYCS